MPLPSTSTADLARHLDALGIAPGDRLVVHSRLIAFGVIAGGVPALAERLRDRVGAEGSIVVPAYCFDATQPYDRRTTPGEGTGALSELIRQSPGAIRSRCPIHNHAGIGPVASVLRDSDPARSLGPGSDFQTLHDSDFKLLLLGCGFSEGCTYLHHMEAVAEVPYRHWIKLERLVVDDDGTVRPLTCRYFARARTDLVTDFEPVTEPLRAAGLLRSAPAHFGHSHACRLRDLHAVAAALLAADPHAFVKPA